METSFLGVKIVSEVKWLDSVTFVLGLFLIKKNYVLISAQLENNIRIYAIEFKRILWKSFTMMKVSVREIFCRTANFIIVRRRHMKNSPCTYENYYAPLEKNT